MDSKEKRKLSVAVPLNVSGIRPSMGTITGTVSPNTFFFWIPKHFLSTTPLRWRSKGHGGCKCLKSTLTACLYHHFFSALTESLYRFLPQSPRTNDSSMAYLLSLGKKKGVVISEPIEYRHEAHVDTNLSWGEDGHKQFEQGKKLGQGCVLALSICS